MIPNLLTKKVSFQNPSEAEKKKKKKPETKNENPKANIKDGGEGNIQKWWHLLFQRFYSRFGDDIHYAIHDNSSSSNIDGVRSRPDFYLSLKQNLFPSTCSVIAVIEVKEKTPAGVLPQIKERFSKKKKKKTQKTQKTKKTNVF